MGKTARNSNDMPKGRDATPFRSGKEEFSGGFSTAFGNPGGPNPGVSPTKGTGQSLNGQTKRMGANTDSAGKNY